VIANNEAQVRRGRADLRFPMAPPRNLHQAMVSSDEIIIVTNLEWANRFAHVSAVKESCAANAKIASVEEGMGAWDLTVDDIRAATQRAKDAIAALAGKRQVRVTSALGTDVTISIEGRPALEVTPIKKRGQMMGPVPLWAEVAFAAVEDATAGTIVVDGVMLGIGLPGQVNEPITWTLEGGRCVGIEGGPEAKRLKEAIAGVDGADVVGEFAFGTSEKAPFGSPSEKGRLGTAHFALGDNHNAYPGGKNVSSLHLDGVVLNASMAIVDDGTWILRDGEWAL
jgi:leucyl aminopeptidase (aminopeptidase T)